MFLMVSSGKQERRAVHTRSLFRTSYCVCAAWCVRFGERAKWTHLSQLVLFSCATDVEIGVEIQAVFCIRKLWGSHLDWDTAWFRGFPELPQAHFKIQFVMVPQAHFKIQFVMVPQAHFKIQFVMVPQPHFKIQFVMVPQRILPPYD